MPDFPQKLHSKLAQRADDNAFRKLSGANDLIDFSSNDYLGYAQSEELNNSALKIHADQIKTQNGATGSRLLSGNHALYHILETKLQSMFGSESALVFNSGYDSNIGFFSSVPQRGDIVFYDEWVHASIRDGIKMGSAKSYKFKHNDLIDLESKIRRSLQAFRLRSRQPGSGSSEPEIYVVTESVFSMDGDSPNLKTLAEFCTKNKYHLVVDEAHAIGVLGKNGKGLVHELGLQNQIFARIITFGKALGTHGAAILASKNLTEYLINFARSFIYTTALPPHSIASVIAALNILNSIAGTNSIAALDENISFFKDQILKKGLAHKFIQSNSAIHSFLLPGNDEVKSLASQMRKNGFDVKPILSPTVPKNQERLRFCLHSFNSREEISDCLTILAKFI